MRLPLSMVVQYLHLFRLEERFLRGTITMLKNRAWHGLKHDTSDFRDQCRVYGASHVKATEDSPVVDLSEYASPSLDQGQLESCTASVLCNVYGLKLRSQHQSDPCFFLF